MSKKKKTKRITWNQSLKLLRDTIKQAAKLSDAFESIEQTHGTVDRAQDAYHFEGQLRSVLKDFEHRRGESI